MQSEKGNDHVIRPQTILGRDSGSGVPCEAEWTAITEGGRLQDIPSSDMLEKPSFRPRMLTWAMTGLPHLPRAADTLQVSASLVSYWLCVFLKYEPFQIRIVSRDSSRHALGGGTHLQPAIEFRTCFKVATIPSDFFFRPGFYDNEERIRVIETWLLFEILNAIGGYSIM